MEANRKRNILNGSAYNRLFPKSEGVVHTVKNNATLPDTLVLIPKVVHKTLSQTKQIARMLKGESLYQTCNNVWDFVYRHIQYKKDNQGYEQIRSPARAWHDRRTGVDCDCYTVFISSILTNLNIPHTLRITKYSAGYFQHIYPVVPYKDGKYIIIDCVTNQFDYEVPYSEKKDYPMELQYLSGFDSNPAIDGAGNGMDELGKIIKRSMAKAASKTANIPMKKRGGGLAKRLKTTAAPTAPDSPASSQPSAPAVKKKKKKLIGKILNKINKINPATVLLRNGILAAMKLNIKNVAKRLRWSYLTQDQAAQNGIEPAKYARIVSVRQKLENIFYGAGGKPDNLRKAILGGKGNKDKAVNGLGTIDMYGVEHLSTSTPLQQLLGPEIYYSENVAGMEEFQGFGELGEPVTLTSVGAAMGVIASIVASLKQIGNIFKGKEKGAEDFDESKTDNPDSESSPESPSPAPVIQQQLPSVTPDNSADESANPAPYTAPAYEPPVIEPEQSEAGAEEQATEVPESEPTEEPIQDMAVQQAAYPDEPETTPEEAGTDGFGSTGDKQSFWQRNKGWIKPVAIGAGGIGLIVLLSKLMQDSKPRNNTKAHQLSGPPKGKGKRKNYQRQSKSSKHKKKAVALM